MTPHVRTRLWRNGVLELEDFPIADISEYLGAPGCLVWADVCNPDGHHLRSIANEVGIDEHYIEDALSPHERPKATRFKSHLFVTTSAIATNTLTDGLKMQRVSAFAMPGALLTVRPDDDFDMASVLERWDDDANLIEFGARGLLHGLLDVIIDGYFEAVEFLDDAIDEAEEILFDERRRQDSELQRHTFALRKSLVTARRVILPMREVISGVMHRNGDSEEHDARLAPYYEDLYDHVMRASEWTESLRDMVSTIFETNMSLADNRMNLVMKKLSAWAAIIAVPTAITGWYGQNVPYPGFEKTWGVVLSASAIVLIGFSLWYSFRKRDWL